jgi:hypothetical protein
MPNKAKTYISLVVGTGLAALAAGVWGWNSQDLVHYACYLLLALAAATLKIMLPGITGTFSLTFLFVLIGAAEMSFAETITIACASAVAQCLWKPKRRPAMVQVLFNVCNLAISATVAYLLFHLVSNQGGSLPIQLALAACGYFVINTLLVSTVLSMVQDKPLKTMWEHWVFWSFPYYLVGAAMAGMVSLANQHVGWKLPLAAFPLMYLVYLCYRLYVERKGSEGMLWREHDFPAKAVA